MPKVFNAVFAVDLSGEAWLIQCPDEIYQDMLTTNLEDAGFEGAPEDPGVYKAVVQVEVEGKDTVYHIESHEAVEIGV